MARSHAASTSIGHAARLDGGAGGQALRAPDAADHLPAEPLRAEGHARSGARPLHVVQLVRSQGVGPATEAVSAGYGAFHVFATLNLAVLAGWIVLALGAWRTRVLGPVRAAALGLTAALPIGVLKGTTPVSLVALTGLCTALVPLGLALLREAPRPSRAAVLRWVPLTLVTVGLMVLVGQAG